MAIIKLDELSMTTYGELPTLGSKAPEFILTDTKLNTVKLSDFNNEIVIINSFPSFDLAIYSDNLTTMMMKNKTRDFIRKFILKKNINLLFVTMDLPFSLKRRLLDAERKNKVKKPEHIHLVSDFRTRNFGANYGLTIMDGIFSGLLARSIIVLDQEHTVAYSKLLPELTETPDFESVLSVVKSL